MLFSDEERVNIKRKTQPWQSKIAKADRKHRQGTKVEAAGTKIVTVKMDKKQD
jgi:hypothetical protein